MMPPGGEDGLRAWDLICGAKATAGLDPFPVASSAQTAQAATLNMDNFSRNWGQAQQAFQVLGGDMGSMGSMMWQQPAHHLNQIQYLRAPAAPVDFSRAVAVLDRTGAVAQKGHHALFPGGIVDDPASAISRAAQSMQQMPQQVLGAWPASIEEELGRVRRS